jgi:hypothetical protein
MMLGAITFVETKLIPPLGWEERRLVDELGEPLHIPKNLAIIISQIYK